MPVTLEVHKRGVDVDVAAETGHAHPLIASVQAPSALVVMTA